MLISKANFSTAAVFCRAIGDLTTGLIEILGVGADCKVTVGDGLINLSIDLLVGLIFGLNLGLASKVGINDGVTSGIIRDTGVVSAIGSCNLDDSIVFLVEVEVSQAAIVTPIVININILFTVLY